MSKKSKLQKKGRICKVAGCKNILSVYNPGILCYIHQQSYSHVPAHRLAAA